MEYSIKKIKCIKLNQVCIFLFFIAATINLSEDIKNHGIRFSQLNQDAELEYSLLYFYDYNEPLLTSKPQPLPTHIKTGARHQEKISSKNAVFNKACELRDENKWQEALILFRQFAQMSASEPYLFEKSRFGIFFCLYKLGREANDLSQTIAYNIEAIEIYNSLPSEQRINGNFVIIACYCELADAQKESDVDESLNNLRTARILLHQASALSKTHKEILTTRIASLYMGHSCQLAIAEKYIRANELLSIAIEMLKNQSQRDVYNACKYDYFIGLCQIIMSSRPENDAYGTQLPYRYACDLFLKPPFNYATDGNDPLLQSITHNLELIIKYENKINFSVNEFFLRSTERHQFFSTEKSINFISQDELMPVLDSIAILKNDKSEHLLLEAQKNLTDFLSTNPTHVLHPLISSVSTAVKNYLSLDIGWEREERLESRISQRKH